MGNGKAKELVCTTRGHELRWGVFNSGGRGMQGGGGKRGGKKVRQV